MPISLIVSLCAIAGCERDESIDDANPTPTETQIDRPTWSAWGTGDHVIAADLEDDPEMQADIEQARKSADSAREQWRNTPKSMRQQWAVKWAAPTEEGGREYIWIQPMHWSRFRIEGRLLSEPSGPLEDRAERGDLLAFSADELVDWVRLSASETARVQAGGFTIKVLEERFGEPGRDDSGRRGRTTSD